MRGPSRNRELRVADRVTLAVVLNADILSTDKHEVRPFSKRTFAFHTRAMPYRGLFSRIWNIKSSLWSTATSLKPLAQLYWMIFLVVRVGDHDQTMLFVVDVNYFISPEVYHDRRWRFSQYTWTTACSPRHLLFYETILFVVHVDQLIVFEDFRD